MPKKFVWAAVLLNALPGTAVAHADAVPVGISVGMRSGQMQDLDRVATASSEDVSAMLPVVLDLPWVEVRLGVRATQLISASDAWKRYRSDYLAEGVHRTQRLDELVDTHFSHTYVHAATGRAVCREWLAAIAALRGIEAGFWARLTELSEVDADMLELARLERMCVLIDVVILNVVPETKQDLRSLLVEAQVPVTPGSAVTASLTEHYRRRTALLDKRLDAILPTIDDMAHHQDAVYGVRDDTLDQLSPGHVSEARTNTYAEAGQKMYRANAALAQLTRRSIEMMLNELDELQKSRVIELIEHRFYPQVYDRVDPVATWMAADPTRTTPATTAAMAAYEQQRQSVEKRMLACVIDYRDTWLACTGHPMILQPRTRFESQMRELTEELTELEKRSLKLLETIKSEGISR